jgi:hypothetical protein
MFSCGPSQEDRASARLNFARNLLLHNDTANALLHIDSIAVLHPKAVFSVNAAKNLKKEIIWELIQINEKKLDTLKMAITGMERNFNIEKTQFDRYAQYLHKRQTWDRSWNRSYIQVLLNER